MKPEGATEKILSLVKSFCGQAAVSALTDDLRRTDRLERNMVTRSPQKRIEQISFQDQSKLDRLITLCHAKLSGDDVCQVLLGIGDIFKRHGEMNRAEEMYSLALRQSARTSAKGILAEAYLRRGELYSRTGQWKQSGSDLGRSRTLFASLNRHDALARVENILGTNYAEQGQLNLAVPLFEHALTLFERTQQTEQAGTVLMNLGIVCNIIGDYDSALAHYKRAQRCFEGIGDMNRLAELHHNMGMGFLSKQLNTQAVREFNTCHALSAKLRNVSLMGLANLGKANAYFRQRDFEMAMKLVLQSIEAFTIASDRLSLADAYKIKGMIHREIRGYAAAESYLQTSLRINLEMNNQLNAAETYFELAALKLKQRKTGDALGALHKARLGFKKTGAQEEEARTRNLINSIEGGKQ